MILASQLFGAYPSFLPSAPSLDAKNSGRVVRSFPLKKGEPLPPLVHTGYSSASPLYDETKQSTEGINLAKKLIVQKQYTKAITILQKETVPKARYYEALCHQRLNNCDQAIKQYKQFIKKYQGYGKSNWIKEAKANIKACKN